MAFDAHSGADLWRDLFFELLGAVRRIVEMAPGASNAAGPRPRALEILSRASDRIAAFDLPERPRRGSPRLAVVMPLHGEDALAILMRTWSGGPPHAATVMSPYFDATDTPSRAAGRLVEVLTKRGASVDFIVPVEYLGERQTAQVPRSLLDAIPSRIAAALFDVKQPNPAEPRRLHGKLILLRSDGWVSALVGSSNFSAPGLGLGGGGNIEVGIAIGAPQGSPYGNALVRLALAGEPVRPEADLKGAEDPEEGVAAVPAGFVQVLGEPGPPASLEIYLDPSALPHEWSARTPDDHELIASQEWQRTGRKVVAELPAPTGHLPFNVAFEWRAPDGLLATGSLSVNVTDPGRLPPPEELRALPLDALLRALASVRPLHEAVLEAMHRHERSLGTKLDDLDPLKRFSAAGQLLHRTRELSAALAGLHERLERPAASLQAFRWRIDGPFGPVEIASKLIEERRGNRSVQGEEAFMLAEISLTLASVQPTESRSLHP